MSRSTALLRQIRDGPSGTCYTPFNSSLVLEILGWRGDGKKFIMKKRLDRVLTIIFLELSRLLYWKIQTPEATPLPLRISNPGPIEELLLIGKLFQALEAAR